MENYNITEEEYINAKEQEKKLKRQLLELKLEYAYNKNNPEIQAKINEEIKKLKKQFVPIIKVITTYERENNIKKERGIKI